MSVQSREKAQEKGQKSGKGTEPVSKSWLLIGAIAGVIVSFIYRLLGRNRSESGDNDGRER
jgi:hypothetical protein